MAKRPSQRRLFRELTEKFGPEVADAYLAAVRDLTSEVELQKLILAIKRRDLQAALDALHITRSAFQPLESKLTEAFIAGGQGAVASMPASVSIGFRFDPGNQRAAAIIRQTAGRLITRLTEEELAQAREILADGMVRGAGPRSVALDLVGRQSRITGNREGGLIGLTRGQREAVAKARAELSSNDPAMLRSYLRRGRRVKYPFDRVVTKAMREGTSLTPEFVDRASRAYSSSLLKYRGEVIGRTEGAPAVRAAKREAYQQLVDDGRVDAQTIVRTWHTVKDGRERETHGAMNGQAVVGLDAPFQSPGGAMLRHPGDGSLGAPASEIVSCRCDESIAVRPRRS